MDIIVEPEQENSASLMKALKQFGFDSPDITEEDFLEKDQIIQLGYEPVRIDLLTSVAGCSFAEIWNNKVTVRYGKAEAFFMGKEQLIKTKKATNRNQDQADLELLGDES